VLGRRQRMRLQAVVESRDPGVKSVMRKAAKPPHRARFAASPFIEKLLAMKAEGFVLSHVGVKKVIAAAEDRQKQEAA
jgi:hypothetical protein